MEFESSVARWPGKIHMPEYMSFPAMLQWEKALNSTKNLGEESSLREYYDVLLPSALDMIEKWEIAGLPEKVVYSNFPASAPLMAWIIECISELYRRTNSTDPKSPEPS